MFRGKDAEDSVSQSFVGENKYATNDFLRADNLLISKETTTFANEKTNT